MDAFASRAHFITRRSVWTAQSESATFYRRDLLERLGGFDEELGIGSATPWQAAEGPDLILNALQRGCMCYYDPSLYGFHLEYDLDDPTEKMPRKGRMYGRGMGYVLTTSPVRNCFHAPLGFTAAHHCFHLCNMRTVPPR